MTKYGRLEQAGHMCTVVRALTLDTVASTVQTSSSYLVAREFNSPIDSLRTCHVHIQTPSGPPPDPLR
eukprot:595326-Prorocentrum_minimum.AAC.1